MTQFVYQPPPDEWDDERRKRMHDLEQGPRTIYPPNIEWWKGLRQQLQAGGALVDDVGPDWQPAEMDPE